MLHHPFAAETLKGRDPVRVVDVCSGVGIAGYAFSKVLIEKGYRVELTLVDVRQDVLLKAREWISGELAVKPTIHIVDAKVLHKVNDEYDLALMWGSSSPHFDPWSMNTLLASVSHVLSPRGLLVMQEADRFRMFLTRGCADIMFVEDECSARMVLDVFKGYDPVRGTCRRRVIDLRNPSRTAVINLYYWSVARLAALSWIFFEDVDVIKQPSGNPLKHLILAYKPRRALSPRQFLKSPYVLKNKEYTIRRI
ncbi:class I SAM-dependent methyltransferase [Pyrodictium abyssi]|uniref:Class I SAM-dependent methyltransferase n=1 Tax=Pyrodictium abyssi TaxID=54256 RepID=A0ABM8IXB4_9CREN|nr:class I SAM-dependent methyltransferase [Pyrodictium abyssi]